MGFHRSGRKRSSSAWDMCAVSDLLVAVAGGGEVRAGRAVGSVMQPGSVLMSEATDIAPRI